MALNLSEEARAELFEYLEKAEPYPEDAQELNVLDGDRDPDRMAATIAKKWLDQDDREKVARQAEKQ